MSRTYPSRAASDAAAMVAQPVSGLLVEQEDPTLIENKYVVAAAALGFLLTLPLTGGSLMAAFGVLALVAGTGWAVRRLSSTRTR